MRVQGCRLRVAGCGFRGAGFRVQGCVASLQGPCLVRVTVVQAFSGSTELDCG